MRHLFFHHGDGSDEVEFLKGLPRLTPEFESRRYHARGANVLIRPLERAKQTASGIHLPDGKKERPEQAVVVAAGPDADVSEGDTVLVQHYAAAKVADDIWCVPSKEILGVMEA